VANDRNRLFWRIVANAATKPLNVLALAAVAGAGILMRSPWIDAAAIPVYGLLVAATIRDPDESERLAEGSSPRALPGGRRSLQGVTGEIRGQVIAVLNEQRAIEGELARSPTLREEVSDQVGALCDDVLANARRASEMELYLTSIDVPALHRRIEAAPAGPAADALAEQLTVVDGFTEARASFDREVEAVAASLGAIRGRLVQARIAATPATAVAADVAGLRERMRILATSLVEAYGHNGDQPIEKGT
jgi:hypothetical protein